MALAKHIETFFSEGEMLIRNGNVSKIIKTRERERKCASLSYKKTVRT